MHLHGYDLIPRLTVKNAKSPRKGFLYFADDGDVAAVRHDNWKMLLMEQRLTGTSTIWQEPFVAPAGILVQSFGTAFFNGVPIPARVPGQSAAGHESRNRRDARSSCSSSASGGSRFAAPSLGYVGGDETYARRDR